MARSVPIAYMIGLYTAAPAVRDNRGPRLRPRDHRTPKLSVGMCYTRRALEEQEQEERQKRTGGGREEDEEAEEEKDEATGNALGVLRSSWPSACGWAAASRTAAPPAAGDPASASGTA